MEKRKMPELLAPAGSMDKLRIAIHYGADAVYFGGPRFSLRAHAVLTESEIGDAVSYAHDHGVKAYGAVNIFALDRDFDGFDGFLRLLKETGVDGLIISDPGLLRHVKTVMPEMPIHLSTQANVTNRRSALFWERQGVKRVNLARELSLGEIKCIRDGIGCEVEVFVHGAICISYSGRCLLSCYLTGRGANQGDCAHPCRYSYRLVEEKRPGEYFPVEEDERGTYVFNSKDLCLLHKLPRFFEIGVDSIKIEGRMKSPYYVGGVVRVYRAALDYLGREMERLGPSRIGEIEMPDQFVAELLKFAGRGYTDNFIDSPPGAGDMLYDRPRMDLDEFPIGIVRRGGREPIVEIRNPVDTDQIIEHLGYGLQSSNYLIKRMLDNSGNAIGKAHPGNFVTFETSPPCLSWRENDLLRTRKNL